MIYLTPEDLNTVISEAHLEQVIEGDQSILDSAELSAIGEITAYLNIRYDAALCFDRLLITPDPPTHNGYNGISTVIQMLVDITLFHALARIMPDNIPTLREKRYRNAIDWCDKVSDGFIAPVLPIKANEPTTPLRYGNSSTKSNQYF